VTLSVQKQCCSDKSVFRQNLFYRALSRIDRFLLSCPARERLFRKSCRILFEEVGLLSVWIGHYDRESRSVRCEVYEGRRGDDPSGSGRQILEQTIKTGSAVVWNDVLNLLSEGPLRDFCRVKGIGSLASFPLTSGETLCGALIVESDETDYFAPELISLISSLAENIALGLKSREREDARKHHESRAQSLLKWMEDLTRETELPDLFRGALEAICQLTNSDNGEVVLWNPSLRAFSLRAVVSRDPRISMEPLLEKNPQCRGGCCRKGY